MLSLSQKLKEREGGKEEGDKMNNRFPSQRWIDFLTCYQHWMGRAWLLVDRSGHLSVSLLYRNHWCHSQKTHGRHCPSVSAATSPARFCCKNIHSVSAQYKMLWCENVKRGCTEMNSCRTPAITKEIATMKPPTAIFLSGLKQTQDCHQRMTWSSYPYDGSVTVIVYH